MKKLVFMTCAALALTTAFGAHLVYDVDLKRALLPLQQKIEELEKRPIIIPTNEVVRAQITNVVSGTYIRDTALQPLAPVVNLPQVVDTNSVETLVQDLNVILDALKNTYRQ